jgi:hypothetical protein
MNVMAAAEPHDGYLTRDYKRVVIRLLLCGAEH